jgi:hypothetical protein
MNIRNLFKNLEFTGKADGDRNSYSVFAGAEAYLVAAPNSRGGLNVNVVPRAAAESLQRKFRHRRVTVTQVLKSSGRSRLFPDRFAALNALYVLVALRQARKLAERDGRALIFKVN